MSGFFSIVFVIINYLFCVQSSSNEKDEYGDRFKEINSKVGENKRHEVIDLCNNLIKYHIFIILSASIIAFISTLLAFSASGPNFAKGIFILNAPAIILCFLFKLIAGRRVNIILEEVEKGRVSEQNEKTRKIKEEEDEDRKFDMVVNCPFCLGTGEAEYECIQVDGDLSSKTLRIKNLHRDRSKEGKTEIESGIMRWYERSSCESCNGEGRVFAYFLNEEKRCENCFGSGKIEHEEKIKEEIGVKINKIKKECKQCSGRGVLDNSYVIVRTP